MAMDHEPWAKYYVNEINDITPKIVSRITFHLQLPFPIAQELMLQLVTFWGVLQNWVNFEIFRGCLSALSNHFP